MQDKDLFGKALGLRSPWFVKDLVLDVEKKRVDIFVDFERGNSFPCPKCGVSCGVYDTDDRVWRHLDFFNHAAYIHARVPRVSCEEHGVLVVDVPWARVGSKFTLLFETMILSLAREMPVKSTAEFAGVNPNTVWRILGHYIESARKTASIRGLSRVGVDEFAIGKGHEYATVFCDLDDSRVLYVCRGKDSGTLFDFRWDLLGRCDPGKIGLFSMDMSPSFISGVEKYFPGARIVFDRFHAMKIVNAALDMVRRKESKENESLKKTRFLWLKNPCNLTVKDVKRFKKVKDLDTRTGKAYQMKLSFQRLWDCGVEEAKSFLTEWCFWAAHSKIRPMIDAARTIKDHENGVLGSIETRANNNVLEGTVNKIKTAMKRAYGFKNFDYLKTIIYLIGGKLELPTRC
jgi:transposase